MAADLEKSVIAETAAGKYRPRNAEPSAVIACMFFNLGLFCLGSLLNNE